MNLKGATTTVVVCVIILSVVEIIQWVLNSFEIIQYNEQTIWIFRGIWLINILLLNIPLLIFFSILRKKQLGGNNE